MCHLQLDVYDLRGIRRMRCCGHCFTFCGVFPLLWWCGWEAHPCTSPLCASYWDVPFCLAILPKDFSHSHSAWRMYSLVFLFWCEPCEHTEETQEERHFKMAALWHIDQIYPVTSAGDTKRHLRVFWLNIINIICTLTNLHIHMQVRFRFTWPRDDW